MYDPQTLAAARERSRKNRKSVKYYLVKIVCDCNLCFGKQLQRPRATVETHRWNYGRHPDAQPRASPSRASPSPRPASPAPIPPHDGDFLNENIAMLPPDNNPNDTPSPTHQLFDEQFGAFARTTCSRPMSSGSVSRSQSMSGTHSPTSHSSLDSHSRAGSPRQPLPRPRAHSLSPSDSDEEAPILVPADPNRDAHIFGELLVRNQGVAEAPPLRLRGGDQDEGMEAGEDDRDGEDDEDSEPGEPNGDGDVQLPPAGPEIHVDPIDMGEPEDPGDDGEEIGAVHEHPILLNVYLRTWVLYAFGNATHDTIQSILKSHKLALLATAQIANFPANLVAQIEKMPLTFRALERRIGMNFSESITIYPICPIETCGKRYTFEELAALPDPQCTRHVAEPRCPGVLYTENTLADGTRKRTPTKSFPYNSIIRALGRLLSRIGIADFMQHWRRPGDEPVNERIPPPLEPEEWLNRVGPDDRFGDITEAWLWRSQGTGLRRRYDGQAYGDEATGDEPLSLVRSPLGLSLGMNMDGFRAAQGHFIAGGSYSVNGVYIVVNNLPFYLRTLVENTILAIVIPGPKEPKGHALDQMLEPLVNDLIALANGVELPVYNRETGRIEQKLVYAQLSALFLDWQARIKCTGHVGITAEHNHCLYCKIRQCLLSLERGFQSEYYEYRDPEEHLQHKHEWYRARFPEREDIRLRNGTKFVELDRIPGFYAFDNCPIDVMHLFDHGITPAIMRDILYKPGMLRKRFHRQPDDETPESCFDAFVERTYFPSHCSRLPTKISKMGAGMKAEQWRTLLVILPVALFEAWRMGDAIPDGNIPRGGERTKNFRKQWANANLLLERRRNAHDLNEGNLEDVPDIEDCASSRNPREYFANVMRYCVAYNKIFRHRITRQDTVDISTLLELVGVTFARMNVHMVPSFHLATHIGDHLLKYGSPFNTWMYDFERLNRLLINVNTNGHGQGVLETTMAKGFMRRAECYRYVKNLQDIEDPTDDDIATTKVLLDAMRNGPEHEAQRGMLNAVLAGEAQFHGQEPIRLAPVPAQIDFRSRKHEPYYDFMIQFMNDNNPFNNVEFYGPGAPPDNGIWLSPQQSTLAYPNFYRHGVRYGSDEHYRGRKSRYGYIYNRRPVLIKRIYQSTVEVEGENHRAVAVMVQRFVGPDHEPVFPWNHWANHLGINAWEFGQLGPVEPVPADAFTGVFALSDIELDTGHYWMTFAMINTEPEDLVADYD